MKLVSQTIEAGRAAYRAGLSYRDNPEPLPRYSLTAETATGLVRVDVDWSDIWLIGWKIQEHIERKGR